MFDTKTLLILIPALPLAASILTAILGPRLLKQYSHLPVIIAIAGSLIASAGLLRHFQVNRPNVPVADGAGGGSPRIGFEEVVTLWNWADVQDAYAYTGLPNGSDETTSLSSSAGGVRPFRIDIALRVDPLTIMMLLMVNFVAALVAVYAAGYMHGDRGYWRFFAYVSLFVFCMNMLVTVSNFLLMFVFWEGVGACSYLLIGFWFEKPSAAAAGKKAFLVNRVGDFGFALAMFFLWTTYGTLNFHDTVVDGNQTISGILGQARLASNAYVGGALGFTICLSLLVGACGKSAQLPLHVWLADAMEGPTPVSALIHAATMVTAGVYMVARCTPLFMASPTAQLLVACVGGATALVAGFIALTQWDLKRVLAYSTISQLGYMFLALGTGTLAGITAGLFHLFTHAFFKALLFLGAGSVMHSMGHVIDMRRFGGLRRIMPITHATFAIGCLALAGIVPFAGFWSKDAILGAVHDQATAMSMASAEATMDKASANSKGKTPASPQSSHADHHGPTTAHLVDRAPAELARSARVYHILYYVGLVSALMTAIYTFRAFFVTFYGDLKIPEEAGHHAHESPPLMWIPLAILAFFAAGIGWVLHRSEWLINLLEYTPSLAMNTVRITPLPGVFHWNVAITSSLFAILGVAVAAYLYLGNLNEVRALSRRLASPWIGSPYLLSRGKLFFDEIYGWLIVGPLLGFASICAWIDRNIVDAVVDLIGAIPKFVGRFFRPLQSGFTPFYGVTMVALAMLIWGVRLLWGAF